MAMINVDEISISNRCKYRPALQACRAKTAKAVTTNRVLVGSKRRIKGIRCLSARNAAIAG